MCRNLNKKRLHFCEKCSLYLIMCPGFQICVGVDAHIDPLGTIEFAEDFRKTGFFRRGDVGIDPYEPLGRSQRFCRGEHPPRTQLLERNIHKQSHTAEDDGHGDVDIAAGVIPKRTVRFAASRVDSCQQLVLFHDIEPRNRAERCADGDDVDRSTVPIWRSAP